MTSVDFLIVAILLLATQLGMRVGLARQLGITLGLLIGIFAAAFTQWQFIILASAANSGWSHLYFWLLAALVLMIALFVDVGYTVGTWLHRKLEKFKRAEAIDTIGGAVTAGITTLVAVWLCSTLVLRGPSPFFASQVRGSFVINSLKQTFPQAPDLFAQAGALLDPNALPTVFAGSEPAVAAGQVSPEMPQSLQQTASAVAPSVIKITGKGCGGVSTGSGFVVADNIIATNAHVIAGTPTPYVIDQHGQHDTETLLFDPRLDLAILRTTGVQAKPLALQTAFAKSGTTGASIGYASGQLLASGATVLSRQNATGYDIYDAKPASRTIYTLNAIIEQGDSGGPVINEQGEVIGMIFAKSSNKANVGYALTADQIDASLKTALAQNLAIPNGQCGRE